jgi:hypothetical protein
VFGGAILSSLDYEDLFAITFSMQCVSLIPYVILLRLVPKWEHQAVGDVSSQQELDTENEQEP